MECAGVFASLSTSWLNLVGFVTRRGCGVWLRRGYVMSDLGLGPRDSRLSRFHILLGHLSVSLSSLVQFVVELVFCLLKLLYRLTDSAGELGQFLCSE